MCFDDRYNILQAFYLIGFIINKKKTSLRKPNIASNVIFEFF